MSKRLRAALLTGTGILLACPSLASAQPLSQEEATALREEVARLKASLARIEARLAADGSQAPADTAPADTAVAAAPATPPATAPAPATPAKAEPAKLAGAKVEWKGSPQIVEGGHAFKPKGRIQVDAGYVGGPGAKEDPGLGFSTEFRRIRLGAEGQFTDNLSYKLELELSDNKVDLVDTFVTFKKDNLALTVGNQNQFQSLDELTGDTTGSFMERAAFTDAFGFERRLGISAQYKLDALTLQAGVFADDINALAASDGVKADENNAFSLDGRVVYAPMVGTTQLHFGGSAHWRKLNRLSGIPISYRQRPFLHSTDSRILATPSASIAEELNYGLEFAAIHGPWHAAAEANWLRPDVVDARNPSYFGGYAEVGYFLTKGDSRAYANTIFGSTSPKRPMDKGGPGAWQVNLRYDYLDLNDGPFVGGKQNAYLASLIWTPMRYLRLNLNYGYLEYDRAALLLGGRRDYGLHMLATRMELDF